MGTLLGAKKLKHKDPAEGEFWIPTSEELFMLNFMNSSPVKSKDLQRMLEIDWKKQSMLALVKANHKELHIEKKWLWHVVTATVINLGLDKMGGSASLPRLGLSFSKPYSFFCVNSTICTAKHQAEERLNCFGFHMVFLQRIQPMCSLCEERQAASGPNWSHCWWSSEGSSEGHKIQGSVLVSILVSVLVILVIPVSTCIY
jgi:hypothetical protein